MGQSIAQFGKIGVLTESIEVIDEYTVALHLTTPYYGVLSDLAMCNPMGIVSPNACLLYTSEHELLFGVSHLRLHYDVLCRTLGYWR